MSNTNTNTLLQAQDAASWYFSHIDVHSPHPENVQRYLKAPLLALTLHTLHHVPLDPMGGEVVTGRHEEAATATTNDWRDYLSPTSGASSSAAADKKSAADPKQSVAAHFWDDKIQSQYDELGRRNQARLEAFLAGCMYAMPSGDEEDDDEDVSSSQQHEHPVTGISTRHLFFNSLRRSSMSNAVRRKLHQPARDEDKKKDVVDEIGDGLSNMAASSPIVKTSRNLLLTQYQRTNRKMIHPQIAEDQLVVRLDLYLRTLQRVRALQEPCVIAMETPKTLRLRARYVTDAFVATSGTLKSMRPVLTRLLGFLTKEILAVEILSESVVKVIRKIVNDYEHDVSFASLAFLSTPEQSADTRLTPLIVKYLKYIQSEFEMLTQDCNLEYMLSHTLDFEMRKCFKTIEFRSIGHLLEVCHDYRRDLQNIELGPKRVSDGKDINTLCNSSMELRQAIRDLQREIITVNGHVLPPVTSRKELLNLLSQTLNSRTLTWEPSKQRPRKHTASKSPQRRNAGNSPQKGEESTAEEEKKSNAEDGIVFSSEYETSEAEGAGDETATDASDRKKVRRKKFHTSTIDLLTRRLLIAASRTGMGGDAYFVVRDLFGGDEVEVVPSNNMDSQGRMVRPGTIDILVRLADVTIKCHASFDVYPKSLVGECEPLIQFHTTTTETISLQEVRIEDSASDDNDATADDNSTVEGSVDGSEKAKRSVMVVRERHTPKTGWRQITIRPALYEKVEVWNTPS